MSPRAEFVVRCAGATRDLLMVTIGLLVAQATPPSLEAFDGGRLGSFAWSMLLIVGGLLSLGGVIRRWPTMETAGCFMVGAGFLIWSIAALCQDERTSVTVAVGLVFLSGTIGQIWRGVVVASRAVDLSQVAP